MWGFALILAWPLLEIGLFVTVGGWLGLWPTLAIVVTTGFAGVALMRWQGMGALREVQAGTVDPVSPMAHGALILLGGFLLMLPGFFTDVLGVLLMIPLLRRLVIAQIASRVRVAGFMARGRAQGTEDWVDAEYEEVVPDRDKIGGPSKWHQD
ncbi:MAG: protein FxsA [Rhodobacteraceae bacterium]|uniref:FxsA family protein n=1 Tax=Cypionkella sp. TaxID=2811411 RepID=UPI001325BC49|nr:FxsA family protein [Cypionkella sp.]KAF0175762.1 MAG: protein FxsA [Paracoccaceae bacterium]MDO8326422.1 FxsA family protein [Cypionkella sp.]